jgi:mannose-6-phosphate isomerase-like protein (cupin superfamily)
MPEGYVVRAEAVAPATGRDGAEVRETIGREQGSPRLHQRVISLPPGRSEARGAADAEAVLYVLAGAGTVTVADAAREVREDSGVYVAPGETWAVDNPGPGELELVAVTLPDPPPAAPGAPRGAVARLADQEASPATSDREFRLVADPDTGCRGATQFVGYIPPGRAPEHYHHYDEVIYVLHGEGVLHLGWGDTPIGRGSCIHLPARLRHSLENVGEEPMQVLGVFRPAGSPAEAYYPDGSSAMTPREGGGAR